MTPQYIGNVQVQVQAQAQGPPRRQRKDCIHVNDGHFIGFWIVSFDLICPFPFPCPCALSICLAVATVLL